MDDREREEETERLSVSPVVIQLGDSAVFAVCLYLGLVAEQQQQLPLFYENT